MPIALPVPAFRRGIAPRSSLAFSWDAADGTLTARTGHAATFTRAGAATADDARGVLRTVPHSAPRFLGWDAANDGTPDYPLLLLEGPTPTGGNLVGYSEDCANASGWSGQGTPTTGATHTASGVTLTLIGDDDGAAQEYRWQNIGFTGTAAKAIRVRVKQGTTSAAGGSAIQLRDTTASADRLLAVITWSGGAPSVAMTTGTHLKTVRRYDGAYDLFFRTTSVTHTNTNQLRLIPANTAAQQGNIYVGGVQAENALTSSSYVKNATTAGGTRVADSLSWAFPDVPKAGTFYVSWVELGTIDFTSSQRVWVIGATPLSAPYLGLFNQTTYNAALNNGSVSTATTGPTAPVYGNLVEVAIVVAADGSMTGEQAINGAAAVAHTPVATANPFAAAYSDTKLWLGGETSAFQGFAGYRAMKISGAARTLAQMRAAW